jgi:hypothetical protein
VSAENTATERTLALQPG